MCCCVLSASKRERAIPPAPARTMKDTATQARRALKRLVLGSASIHQYLPIGLRDPQSEVSVWLHGLGAPWDVTYSNVAASTRPLTLGIGLGEELHFTTVKGARPSLQFRERQRENRLLGEMDLRPTEAIPLDGGQLFLFEPQRCKNALPLLFLPATAVPEAFAGARASDSGRPPPLPVRILPLSPSSRSGERSGRQLDKHCSDGSHRTCQRALLFAGAA